MFKIDVDEEVFSYLQKHARPFIDTPNDVLRMKLLVAPSSPTAKNSVGGTPSNGAHKNTENMRLQGDSTPPPRRTKAPRADLATLVNENLLSEGENLNLVDYQGNVLPFTAKVYGRNLLYSGRQWSMSELAQKLLKEVGYQSDSVRGPQHWANSRGETIKTLWSRFQAMGI